MLKDLDNQQLDTVFRLLDGRLMRAGASPVHLVVCAYGEEIQTMLNAL